MEGHIDQNHQQQFLLTLDSSVWNLMQPEQWYEQYFVEWTLLKGHNHVVQTIDISRITAP